jgi:hypothetical protein
VEPTAQFLLLWEANGCSLPVMILVYGLIYAANESMVAILVEEEANGKILCLNLRAGYVFRNEECAWL